MGVVLSVKVLFESVLLVVIVLHEEDFRGLGPEEDDEKPPLRRNSLVRDDLFSVTALIDVRELKVIPHLKDL